MSNTLQETLDQIKLDKDTNLLPENLKKGVSCLGVIGTLEEGEDLDTELDAQDTAAEALDTTIQDKVLATYNFKCPINLKFSSYSDTSLDLTGLDTSNMTNMSDMFLRLFRIN